MDNPLSSDQRNQIMESLKVMMDFYTEYASDAELFRLQELLSSHCGNVAMKMEMREGIDSASQLMPESVNRALQQEIAQRQMLQQHIHQQRGY